MSPPKREKAGANERGKRHEKGRQQQPAPEAPESRSKMGGDCVQSSDPKGATAATSNPDDSSCAAQHVSDDTPPATAATLEMKELETKVRTEAARTNPAVAFLVNNVAAFFVFAEYLLTLETLLCCALSVGATLYVYHVARDDGDSFEGGRGMNWYLLTFAVVGPMSTTIGLSFRRREFANGCVENVRIKAYQIYTAHASWDWKEGEGRRASAVAVNVEGGNDDNKNEGKGKGQWLEHSDEALTILLRMGDEMRSFLTLPTFDRARHRLSGRGRDEARRTAAVAHRLCDSFLTSDIAALTRLIEVMKRHGLPPNEAIRVRQWERLMGTSSEDLRLIKTYRTPQALRSFARLFSVLLPPLYSPYFAQVAMDANSLGLGLAFAMLISVALTALFQGIQVLEDPFVAPPALGGIDVQQEFSLYRDELVGARAVCFPDAPCFQEAGQEET